VNRLVHPVRGELKGQPLVNVADDRVLTEVHVQRVLYAVGERVFGGEVPRYPSDLSDDQWKVLEPQARAVMKELVIAAGRPMARVTCGPWPMRSPTWPATGSSGWPCPPAS
jgi:hypothetical protein